MYRTERLVMREWRESDIEPFSQMCADPRVMRYFPALLTQEESAAFVERVMQRHVDDGFGSSRLKGFLQDSPDWHGPTS